jgi:hypothetical protein
MESEFRHCSICKQSIAFGQEYYQCSVSTCNRARIALYFCSVSCWDAHLPDARHREAWAEPVTAPSREAWEREQAEQARRTAEKPRAAATAEAPAARLASPDTIPREVLIVVSKGKDYVRARSGMNTSDGLFERLSDRLRHLCDLAIASAARDGRKTVLDRDLPRPLTGPRVIRRPPA